MVLFHQALGVVFFQGSWGGDKTDPMKILNKNLEWEPSKLKKVYSQDLANFLPMLAHDLEMSCAKGNLCKEICSELTEKSTKSMRSR